MAPGPPVLSTKYIIKNNLYENSDGLGITVDTQSVTFTNFIVGKPFVVNIYVDTSSLSSTTLSGATVITKLGEAGSTGTLAYTFIGVTTASSVVVTFSKNIGSGIGYLFTAYQITD